MTGILYYHLNKVTLEIVGWWLGQHGKCCVYAKRMFSQNFRIYEKKLARRSAYLVYKGKSWILQLGKT